MQQSRPVSVKHSFYKKKGSTTTTYWNIMGIYVRGWFVLIIENEQDIIQLVKGDAWMMDVLVAAKSLNFA
jgi:hypothetical protein